MGMLRNEIPSKGWSDVGTTCRDWRNSGFKRNFEVIPLIPSKGLKRVHQSSDSVA
jgi:hypothetical protein